MESLVTLKWAFQQVSRRSERRGKNIHFKVCLIFYGRVGKTNNQEKTWVDFRHCSNRGKSSLEKLLIEVHWNHRLWGEKCNRAFISNILRTRIDRIRTISAKTIRRMPSSGRISDRASRVGNQERVKESSSRCSQNFQFWEVRRKQLEISGALEIINSSLVLTILRIQKYWLISVATAARYQKRIPLGNAAWKNNWSKLIHWINRILLLRFSHCWRPKLGLAYDIRDTMTHQQESWKKPE